MKKQVYLEAVRGLAALLVVAAHYMAAFYPASVLGKPYQMHQAWESLFTTTPLSLLLAGHFAVCLFFVLSGYVLSLPYFGQSPKDTEHLLAALLKRPFRLAGLVIASELVSYCLLRTHQYYNVELSRETYSIPWFQSYWFQQAGSFKHLVVDLSINCFEVGPGFNGPLWTITTELYGSFLTFIFLLLFRKSNLRLLAYVLACVYFRSQLYQGFIFGILLADFMRNRSGALLRYAKDIVAWPVLGVGLVFASYPTDVSRAELNSTFYAVFPPLPWLGGGYSMLGAVVVFVALLLNPWLQHLLTKPLFAFLGRISYAVYAFHFLLLGSFSSWLFLVLRPGLGYNNRFMLVTILSIGILLWVSHYISRYVDEPVTRGANRLAKTWLQSTTSVSTSHRLHNHTLQRTFAALRSLSLRRLGGGGPHGTNGQDIG